MAVLQRQIVDLRFGGLDTKTAQQLVGPGASLVLQNAEFTSPMAISKRNGYTSIGKSVLGGGSVSAGVGLAKYRGSLLLSDGVSVYAQTGISATPWVSVGRHLTGSIVEDQTTLCRAPSADTATDGTTIPASCVDFAVLGDIGLFASVSGTTLCWSLVSMSNRSTLASGELTDIIDDAPARVIATATQLHLVRQKIDNTLVLKTWTAATVASVPEDVVINTGWSADGGSLELAYHATSGCSLLGKVASSSRWYVARFDATGKLGTVADFSHPICTGLTYAASGKLAFLGFSTSPSQQVTGYLLNADLTTSATQSASTTVGSTTVYSQAVCKEYAADSFRYWFWNNGTTRVYQFTAAAIAPDPVYQTIYAVSPASRVFTHAGRSVAWFLYTRYLGPSSSVLGTQQSYFLFDLDAETPELQGVAFASNAVDSVSAYNSIHKIGVSRVIGGAALLLATPGANIRLGGYLVTLDATTPMRHCETASGVVLTGLMPRVFDGRLLMPVSHVLYPEISEATQSASAGTIPAGTYYAIAIVERTLANESVMRSETSVPVSVTVDGSHAIQVTFGVPSFAASGSNVKVFLSSDAETYYLGFTTPTLGGSVTISSFSASTEILYTQGGTLDNGCPPCLLDVIERNDRLYGIGANGRVYYTKEIQDTIAPEWSPDYMVKQIRTDGGSYWQLASMDSRLVILGEASIQICTGDGLDSAGSSDNMSAPEMIPVDSGIDQNTPVVVAPEGVWFKSPGGICTFGRDLSVAQTGLAVDSFASLTTVSAVLVSSKNQVRFGHSDGSTLVFDTVSKVWSEFTNHTHTAAIDCAGVYTLLKSDGTVWSQSTGYLDDATSITMVVETPWLRFQGIQAAQRIYWLTLLGEYRSTVALAMAATYDDSRTAETPVSYSQTGGTVGDPVRVRMHSGRRASAMKLKITDSSTGEGARISGLTAEVGIAPQIRRGSETKIAI